MMPRILVLGTTYNGEKYLNVQIDSILNQKDVEVYVLFADDKSTDNTGKILAEYKEKYENFDYYINDKNKGFTYNFIDLLFLDKKMEFDYYAFADQDDYWENEKLINAISKIKDNKNEKGCLYCSNLKLVDENLNQFGIQEKKDILKTTKYNYLVSNICTGCTVVFNSKFYQQVTKYYPKNIYLHDYWIFLISVFTADYYYDFSSYIKYRQHSGNQIGSNKKFLTKGKIKNFLNPKHKTSELIKEFYLLYKDELSEEDKKYIKICFEYNNSILSRLKLLFSPKIRRRKHNLLFKIKVLLGKY
jgi:rhamnosyltransferase